MILWCERCHMTDGNWVLAMRRLRHAGGGLVDVWRHRPCRELLAVPVEVAMGV